MYENVSKENNAFIVTLGPNLKKNIGVALSKGKFLVFLYIVRDHCSDHLLV